MWNYYYFDKHNFSQNSQNNSELSFALNEDTIKICSVLALLFDFGQKPVTKKCRKKF